MVTVLLFILVLGVLVLVHEAGHAIVARFVGCRVEEFGIGFPPRLFARRIGETSYAVNLIPIGGYVRITGEDDDAASRADPRSFAKRSRPRRLAVLLAGVLMNLLLAWVLFTVIAGVGTTVVVENIPASFPLGDRRVGIVDVKQTPVLTNAGIRAGDDLLEVNGKTVATAAEAAEAIRGFGGAELLLVVRRDMEPVPLRIVFPDGPHVVGEPIGLGLINLANYRVSWFRAPSEGARATGRVVVATVRALRSLARDLLINRVVPRDIAGPVGIGMIVGTVGREGILPLMELTAILSVNLALLNVLPFPALDGGRVFFVLLEFFGIRGFRGKPERLVHAIGFAVLLGLMLLITVHDIRRLLTP